MLRLTLINAGYSPDQVSIQELLRVAYEDFTSWRKSKKIPCSQRMFKASQVDRLAHGAYLAAKAWNSRILLQWLHESAVQAATLQNFDSTGGRTLGVWLAEEVRAGRRAWPTASDTPFLFLEPLASHFGCKVLSALIMIFVMLHPRHASLLGAEGRY